MHKYELAGTLAAFALMVVVVGWCWPGKRVPAASPRIFSRY